MNQPPASGRRSRDGGLFALIEVLMAFLVMHVAYRAFKRFTESGRLEGEAGLNFSPGTAMILMTVLILLVRRRSWKEYGLTMSGWRAGLGLGLACAVVELTGAGLLYVSLPGVLVPFNPRPDMVAGLITAGAFLLGSVVFIVVLSVRSERFGRIPTWFSVSILIALLAVPIVVAASRDRPVPATAAAVAWNFFCAGFGEEIFFRGYVQSRLNQSFGRPWRVRGIPFGPGLIIAALLFGFLHALNTVDYFAGHWEFAWWSALAASCAGLFYGLIRERTGSILAGAICHGLGDALALVPKLLATATPAAG